MTSFTATMIEKNILGNWTGTFYYSGRFYTTVPAATEEAAKEAVSMEIRRINEYVRRCDEVKAELKALLKTKGILFMGGWECVIRIAPPARGYEHCHDLKSLGPLWRAAADVAAKEGKESEFIKDLVKLTDIPCILYRG